MGTGGGWLNAAYLSSIIAGSTRQVKTCVLVSCILTPQERLAEQRKARQQLGDDGYSAQGFKGERSKDESKV